MAFLCSRFRKCLATKLSSVSIAISSSIRSRARRLNRRSLIGRCRKGIDSLLVGGGACRFRFFTCGDAIINQTHEQSKEVKQHIQSLESYV